MKNFKVIVSWLLVFVLMFIIFYFSHQKSTISSETSNSLTKTIFNLFNLDEFLVFDTFHSSFRKLVHFGVYLILGLLLYNALFLTFNKSYLYLLSLTILLVALYAGSDEFHQLFINGRSCEIRDVFIDTSGGSLGAMIYYLFTKIRGIKDDL